MENAKKFELPLQFIGRKTPKKYLFVETDLKNPAGQVLFEGLPTNGKGYLLHYTEQTLIKLNAKEVCK